MTENIHIPLSGSKTSSSSPIQTLVLSPQDVKDQGRAIVNVLQKENVPIDIWMNCARCLLNQGQIEDYSALLRIIANEAQKVRNATFLRIQALCSLGDLKLQQAKLSSNDDEKRSLAAEARILYFDAQKLDGQEMLPLLGIGEVALFNVRQ